MAYAEIGGEFERILFGSRTVDIGPLVQYFPSGGFANGDFTVEYAISYPEGELYSIDTSDATTSLIGPTNIAGAVPYGPRWNPQTGTSYVMAPNASCGSSSLYTIDLSTGATSLVGNADGCIPAIAIDPATGTIWGIDVLTDADELVLIDASTGAIQSTVWLLSPFTHIDAMDFAPANGRLYVIGENTFKPNPNLYVFVPGFGMLWQGPAEGVAFAFAARDGFFNGFESIDSDRIVKVVDTFDAKHAQQRRAETR